MSRLWSMIVGLRPWLVSVVVWLVAVTVVYVNNENASTAAVIGVLLTFLVGSAGLVRVAWPMRTYGNPPMMVAAAKKYVVHTYTGRVGSSAKTSNTAFTAESAVTQNPVTGDVSHRLTTSQRTTIQDDVTLLGADGTQHNVQVRDVNLSVGPGQLVSAAWAIRPGGRKGPYVVFRNHATGVNFYPRGRLWWLATGPGAVGYVICMWLGGLLLAGGGYGGLGALWFALAFVYVGLGYYRAARFRRTSRTLIDFLDGVAATFRPVEPQGTAPLNEWTPAVAAQPVQPATPVPAAPSAIAPPASIPPPPAWLSDPTGRHQHRFWDGSVWTDQVGDAGVAATDPL